MNTRPWELVKIFPHPVTPVASYRLRNHAEDHESCLRPLVEAAYVIIYNPWGDSKRQLLVDHEIAKMLEKDELSKKNS